MHEGLLLGIQEYSSRRGRCTTRKALRSKKKRDLTKVYWIWPLINNLLMSCLSSVAEA